MSSVPEAALDGGTLLAGEVSPAVVAAVLTLVYADELDLALRVAQEGLSLAEEHGDPASFALASAGVARVLHDCGQAAGGGGRRQRRPGCMPREPGYREGLRGRQCGQGAPQAR